MEKNEKQLTFEEIVTYCKQQGFVYQGSEIYGGLSNTWDFGPLGALLKQNIKAAWTKYFIQAFPRNQLLNGPILLNNLVWQASGHVKSFSDPLIECKACNQRFRADKLVFDFNGFEVDGMKTEEIEAYIAEHKIPCQNCQKTEWLPLRAFNMMFETYQGVVQNSTDKIYLRPENAQNIFIQFKNVLRTTRTKLPFGIGQIGKAFRNEITPGNFIFRTREFEQMELEYFVKPGTELEVFAFFKKYCMQFLTDLGVNPIDLVYSDHKKEALAFYSNATTDIQYHFPWGFDELWGIASRTDYDLSQHQKFSGQDMSYLDPDDNSRFVPYCVEPSVGVERLFFMFIVNALKEEEVAAGDIRQVLKISPFLAPYKAAIIPLNKSKHSELAESIYRQVAKDFDCYLEESGGSVGKKYRRQDAIGTPFCITVDFESEGTQTVTIRDRDTMQQERIPIKDINQYLLNKIKL